MRPSILFISNIPTPYQLDFWTAVKQHADVNIAFCTDSEQNRHWEFNTGADQPNIYILSKSNSIPQQLKNCTTLYKLFRAKRYSHIIIGGYSRIEFLFCFLLAIIQKIPKYFWLERPLSIKTPLQKNFLFTLLFKNTHVIAIGKLAADFYRKYARDVTNIPYSVDTDAYKTANHAKPGRPVTFLFIGQFIARKNILGLIDQFKIACKDKKVRTNCFLRMIGDGEQKLLMQSELQHSGLTNWEIKPFLQKQEIIAELHRGDVLIIPSRHDGWAVVVNEAISAGLAVIATTSVGAAHDIIQPYECGTVITSLTEIPVLLARYTLNRQHLLRHQKSAVTASQAFSATFLASKLMSIIDSDYRSPNRHPVRMHPT